MFVQQKWSKGLVGCKDISLKLPPSSEQRISVPGQLLCKRYRGKEEQSVHHT